MPRPAVVPLPVDAIVPELLSALDAVGTAVVHAPPGSGKTTRIPLALLGSSWLGRRRILVLEPRRVAARAAAARMAWSLGEATGGRVGYRIRQERRGGADTRVEVITEGILVRMLQSDPSLEDVGAVIFDEFHERTLAADLGLALTLDVRRGLRPDLRVLVMSATLDTAGVAELLGGAAVLTASTTTHSVTTLWVGRPQGRLESAVARAARRAVEEQPGDVLIFLPGAHEIRQVRGLLTAVDAPMHDVDVVELHGALPGAQQDEALRPGAVGRRKIVLATSIAETSLTIDGVGAVVDCGLMRVPRFDPASGMTRLVTLPVSQASADQRRGRAGRQGPGRCYRLWSAAEHTGLPRTTPPEMLVADLAGLALELAEWGVDDPALLAWLDPPPAGPLAAARTVVAGLGAIDADRRITSHGRAIGRLGVHPRIGHMLLRASSDPSTMHLARLASEVAAVLSEGSRAGSGRHGADLTAHVEAIRHGRSPASAESARRWRGLLEAVGTTPPTAPRRSSSRTDPVIAEDVGRLVALAYPERVGRRRPGRPGQWLLRNGRAASVAPTDSLADATWIVAAELDGDRRDARIFLGAPLDEEDVLAFFAGEIVARHGAGWDEDAQDVVAFDERRLGAIVVSSSSQARPRGEAAATGLREGVRTSRLGLLPWTVEVERLRARVAFARRIDGERWPDLGDGALLRDLDAWLTPWLVGRESSADLRTVPLADALWSVVGPGRRAELDALAPSRIVVPTGDRRRIEYPPEGPPYVVVRLQEMFGLDATPTVARGRVPLQLRLTSPAGRPVQVTSDLASFWSTTYRQVRAELRARYPRHSWPDDPLAADPTSRATPRRR